MKLKHFGSLPLLLLCLYLPARAQSPVPPSLSESIHALICPFPFSQENRVRLAIYAEMKGQSDPSHSHLHLDLEGLGVMNLYPGNCLLRTRSQIYHLDRSENRAGVIDHVNWVLDSLLSIIPLMHNGTAPANHLRLVDEELCAHPIEPFDKLYLRYLLLHYGQYDPVSDAVELHTDWLPRSLRNGFSQADTSSPLKLRLDRQTLRGYYLRSGGTVYVEKNAQACFATGESYSPSITAFKQFVQRLFPLSVQYVVNEESARLDSQPGINWAMNERPPQDMALAPHFATALYGPLDWIPMMVGMLRARNISLADPEIIQYFLDEPYFPRIYELLTPEERQRVDAMR